MNKHARWSEYEEQILVHMARSDRTIKEIAEALGRTKKAVTQKSSKLGIYVKRSNDWRIEEDEKMKILVDEGKNSSEIAKILDRPRITVYFKMQALKAGVSRIKPNSSIIEESRVCLDCNLSFKINDTNFTYKNNKRCRKCYTVHYQQINKRKKENLDLLGFIKYRCGSSKIASRKRNMDYTITPEYVENLYIKQNGKCYYTGRVLTFNLFDPNSLSIDRIDSTKGYIIDNIVLCCVMANFMKQDYSQQEFLEACQDIAKIHSK